MNATIKWIVILVFLAGCNRKENAEKKSFSDQVDSLMMSIPDFSGVVLVADNGKPVYHKSFGLANAETKMQMDTTSVFELASVSKQFTALLVAMLQEENKLNYDDPVEKYLPNLPYPNITIRQLLNHTSGLPDYQKLMDEQWDKTKVANNDDIISYLKKFHPPHCLNRETNMNTATRVMYSWAALLKKHRARNLFCSVTKRFFGLWG